MRFFSFFKASRFAATSLPFTFFASVLSGMSSLAGTSGTAAGPSPSAIEDSNPLFILFGPLELLQEDIPDDAAPDTDEAPPSEQNDSPLSDGVLLRNL